MIINLMVFTIKVAWLAKFKIKFTGGNFHENVDIYTDVTVDLRKYMISATEGGRNEEKAKQVFCATPLATLTVKCTVGKTANKS